MGIRRRRTLTIFFLICVSIGLKGQNINALKVGDTLPNFKILKIINSKSKTVHTISFKHQLLIVDFWSTGCSGCIEALPRMQALQKKFGKKIKLLPVTNEAEKSTKLFWKNNKYTKNLSLTSVVEDKLFNMYFPHTSVPHEVWIYKGKVVGITSSEYVDENNIAKVLQGEKVNWPLKYDFYNFDSSKPLFSLNPMQIDTSSYVNLQYAAICDYKPGVNSDGFSGGSGITRDKQKGGIRSYFLNQPIFNSYLLKWSRVIKVNELKKPSILFEPNQVVWEVTDRSMYRYTKQLGYSQDWIRVHGICFESYHLDSGQNDRQVNLEVIRDLDKLLGLHVRWEKRNEIVWVLRESPKKKIVKKISRTAVRINVGELISILNNQEDHPYVFDRRKDKGDTTLELDTATLRNVSLLNLSISPYGLEIEPKVEEVDKMIFSEVSGGLIVDGNMQSIAKKQRMDQASLTNATPDESLNFLKSNKANSDIIVLPSGLQYKVIKMGNGAKPKLNSRVKVYYKGMEVNGKIFDSSFERGRAAEFSVDGVIKGWTEALQLMPEGSKWTLFLPASLAYGEHTGQGKFPPNSTLIFEIELLQILN